MVQIRELKAETNITIIQIEPHLTMEDVRAKRVPLFHSSGSRR